MGLINRIKTSLYVLINGIPAKKIEQPIRDIPSYNWLSKLNISTIINIGANEGQFVLKLRKYLPNAMIYAFEPLPEPLEKLKDTFKSDSYFKVYPFAIGLNNAPQTMYLNQYSPSSSLLKMKDKHVDHFEFTEKVTQITIEERTLDSFYDEFNFKDKTLITLDVQGYELNAIKGGLKTLQKADIIIAEVSFSQLYENQPLFDDINSILKELGFSYAGNFEQLLSPINNEILQADAIFVK